MTAALIAGLLAFVGVANAAHATEISRDKVSYNVGADLSLFNDTLTSHNGMGANVFAGARLNKNLGVEFGLGFLGNQTGFSSKVKNIYADILGYMPIQNTNFELIGTVGIGSLYATPNDTSYFRRTTSVGLATLRAGVGAQYNIDQNWGVRAMARYQIVHVGVGSVDDVSGTLGVVYTF